jgi:hypothetical protein
MLSLLSRKLRACLAGAGLAGILAVSLTAGGSAVANDRPYLAVGDSVPFGFIFQAGFAYINPDNFVGYPAYVGNARDFRTFDTACPGETTSHFISTSGADNGCGAYHGPFPLHVSYTGAQLAHATAFLSAHPNTKLVSVQLGANDGFLLQKSCGGIPSCIIAHLPALLATVSTNMDTILKALHATHFHGVLMVVNYYSLDYADAAGTVLTSALNGAIASHAAADGAVVADVFSAFQTAASTVFAAHHTCKAGLLNANPTNPLLCDVHPSQSGHELIAETIGKAYNAAASDE